MGGFQSTEKKSPSKTVKEDSSKSAGKVEKTPVKTKAVGEPQIRVSPPKTPPTATDIDLSVTEEDMASVEAAATKIRDSLGGTSLEIVLSPAIKKPKSRVSPPTSPAGNEQNLAKKLQEAEERKAELEQDKLQKLAAKLEKITIAKEKKEKKAEEFSAKVLEKIESKQCHAEELRKKQNEEIKDKVSEHAAKIEKAQQALEAAIEDAKEATKTAIEKKMNQVEEKKSEQLEEMLTALKDHSERVQNVRSNMELQMKSKAQQIVENMAKKEQAAKELKANEAKEAQRKIEKRRELVKQNKEKLAGVEANLTPEEA